MISQERSIPSKRCGPGGIPASEIELFLQQVRAHASYRDPEYVKKVYRKACAQVISDPLSADASAPIITALERQTPFSAIRIGDGEANILAYAVFSDTPNLDGFALEKSVAQHSDSFKIGTLWMSILQEMMLSSILQADIIGVIGLWRVRQELPVEAYNRSLGELIRRNNLRGQVGQFRAVQLVMRLASKGVLKNKIIASAHFYFSILAHMDSLFAAAKKVICVTDKKVSFERLREKYPSIPMTLIPVGLQSQRKGGPSTNPDFLQKVRAALPEDLRGCLCLVGAGIWAEIYCSWIKRRGGVAVDLGSGFDLLAGQMTRLAHQTVLGESWDGDISTLNRIHSNEDRFILRKIIEPVRYALSAMRHR